jgi:hypothetical protein
MRVYILYTHYIIYIYINVYMNIYMYIYDYDKNLLAAFGGRWYHWCLVGVCKASKKNVNKKGLSITRGRRGMQLSAGHDDVGGPEVAEVLPAVLRRAVGHPHVSHEHTGEDGTRDQSGTGTPVGHLQAPKVSLIFFGPYVAIGGHRQP